MNDISLSPWEDYWAPNNFTWGNNRPVLISTLPMREKFKMKIDLLSPAFFYVIGKTVYARHSQSSKTGGLGKRDPFNMK